MFAVLFLLTSSEHSTSKVELRQVPDNVSQTEDDQLQKQTLQSIHKLLGSTTAQQIDSASPANQLESSEKIREDDQVLDDEESPAQKQQQLDEDEVDEKRNQMYGDNGESETQNYLSENAHQTVDENDRQSAQQPKTKQSDMSERQTVDSQVQGPAQTQQAERCASGKQSFNVQVQMKTSAVPEKKQQVAVVHAHERSYPRLEDRALSRVRNEIQDSSVSRQPTIESFLSIESTSSHQLSQASLVWHNEQLQAGTRHQDVDQTASVQQQYEQLKNQLQQQLELQRSQLEREYQLREDQMKQQMMMQWQYFTQQQQQQQMWQCNAVGTQVLSGIKQNTDTRCQNDPCSCTTSNFALAPNCTNISSACLEVPVQQVQLPHEDRCRCAGDKVVPSVAGVKTQSNRRDVGPVVVNVVSHSRSRDDAEHRRWPGSDAGHCRIIVGDADRLTTMNDKRRRDVEQTGQMMWSGPAESHVCPTCGHQCETSDGKNVLNIESPTRSRRHCMMIASHH